ncbi:MAG: electron transfer flavoprotein subunit beta, partial [Thermoanaerobaculia bacterium]
GVGFDQGQTGPMVAAILGLPYVNAIVELKIEGNVAKVKREVEGASLRYECKLPCVLTAEKGLNTPRFASLKGIMAAKKKPIEVIKATDLFEKKEIIEINSLQLPPQKKAGKVISGEDPAKAAEELLKFLKEEAKII